MNSYKNFSIIDYRGYFIYAHVALAKNDRDFSLCTPLYMKRGEYFTAGDEWIAEGNKAKWNYTSYTLHLSIQAASKLYNWLMNTEGLSYDALTSAETMFRAYY